MDFLTNFTMRGLNILSTLFVIVVGLLFFTVLVLYFIDSNQSKNAVRRNYPVVGRFRDIFLRLGEFFRQYFFALDREELPFNRAEREWIYKSSKGHDNTEPFGSTQSMSQPGTCIFVNTAYPPLEDPNEPPVPVIFGPDCPNPYTCTSIVNISGMSYGALSKPAIQALSHGAKLAGCWLNTGEGGLSPFHLEGGCDIIFQIGTAKYGVRDEQGNLWDQKLKEIAGKENVRMIEVKLAQGAKPGKGGMLPAEKVSKEIAEIRGIPEGKASISPNRHPEIGSNAELLDFIHHVRTVAEKPVGIKTVMGSAEWFEDFCEDIQARGHASAPDFITLDGGDGGTGAAPLALMDNTGLTLREALPKLVNILKKHGLRERIKIICSGKLITPTDVAWAYCAGTDVVNTARGFMFSIGCIQAMSCNTNNCPTGITTHKPHLQHGLDPNVKASNVQNFVEKMHKDVTMIAHTCGVHHPRELTRKHVRIIQPDGKSALMSEVWPEV